MFKVIFRFSYFCQLNFKDDSDMLCFFYLRMCKNEYLSFSVYVIANYVEIANRECDAKADIVLEYWLFT